MAVSIMAAMSTWSTIPIPRVRVDLPVSLERSAANEDSNDRSNKGREKYSPEAVYNGSLVWHLGYDPCQ